MEELYFWGRFLLGTSLVSVCGGVNYVLAKRLNPSMDETNLSYITTFSFFATPALVVIWVMDRRLKKDTNK